jgi:hypothetical protein
MRLFEIHTITGEDLKAQTSIEALDMDAPVDQEGQGFEDLKAAKVMAAQTAVANAGMVIEGQEPIEMEVKYYVHQCDHNYPIGDPRRTGCTREEVDPDTMEAIEVEPSGLPIRER